MLTIHHSIARASFTHRIGRVFAAFLLIGSLALTGCDSIDSNAREEEGNASSHTAIQQRAVEDILWITLHDGPEVLNQEYTPPSRPGWPMSHMVGTWALVTADVHAFTEYDSQPLITFREDGIFTGYATCYTFSGRYQASSDWTFTVSDFRANHKFCYEENDSIRDVLFAGLQSATQFRFEHGTLWIMSGGKRMTTFIFVRMEDERKPDNIGMPPASSW